MRYYYADSKSQPQGPHTEEELQQFLANGTIREDSWVIEEGGKEWKPCRQVLSGSAPEAMNPPAPPQPWATQPPPSPQPSLANPNETASLTGNSPAQPEPNPAPLSVGEAILWFICCAPIGMMRYGQPVKGWIWLLIAIGTGGVGTLAWIVDYWMCWSIQQKRKLAEWEFFPQR